MNELKWVVLSSESIDKKRYEVLTKALSAGNFANSVEFIENISSDFAPVILEAKNKFGQIRVGGELRTWIVRDADQIPSTLMSVRAADAIVWEKNQTWWPRCMMIEGMVRSFSKCLPGLDFKGGVFIYGATPEASAAVSALSHAGFHGFLISDPNEERGRALVADLERRYFKIKFNFVPRHQLTQIPGVNSIAINTLEIEQNDPTLGELSYFNFLKSGGLWIDLSPTAWHAGLQSEAVSVGARTLGAVDVLAHIDVAWVETALGVSLDVKKYSADLAAAYQIPTS